MLLRLKNQIFTAMVQNVLESLLGRVKAVVKAKQKSYTTLVLVFSQQAVMGMTVRWPRTFRPISHRWVMNWAQGFFGAWEGTSWIFSQGFIDWFYRDTSQRNSHYATHAQVTSCLKTRKRSWTLMWSFACVVFHQKEMWQKECFHVTSNCIRFGLKSSVWFFFFFFLSTAMHWA